jgi:hypothetical protein
VESFWKIKLNDNENNHHPNAHYLGHVLRLVCLRQLGVESWLLARMVTGIIHRNLYRAIFKEENMKTLPIYALIHDIERWAKGLEPFKEAIFRASHYRSVRRSQLRKLLELKAEYNFRVMQKTKTIYHIVKP